MSTCAGTKRDGEPCTLPAARGSSYCYNHDPARAEERSRHNSRAATIKNTKVGQEIRDARELVLDLVGLTVSGELHPKVRRGLQTLVQFLQTYARLTELEMAAGEEGPKFGPLPVALPPDTGERVREWVDGEEERVREKEEVRAEGERALSEAAALAESMGHDADPLRYLAG